MTDSTVSRTAFRLLFVATLAGIWILDRRAATNPAPGGDKAAPFRLEQVQAQLGLDFEHQACHLDPVLAGVEPHVAGLGAAVAVCDANGDGRPDLFTTSSAFGSTCALFVQQPDGTFRDEAAGAGLAQLSIAGEGAAMGSIWADADGDGDQDCFLYRYGYTALFANDGAMHFRDVAQEAGVRRWMNSNAATWLDFDRDGLLDLYVGGYFSEAHDLWHLASSRIMQSSFEFADNGGHNALLRNLGGLRFEDVTARTGCDSTRWTMAIAAADFNDDGFVDLYLANDYGPEQYFENVGGERFESRTDVGLSESSKSGMSVAVGDFEGSGSLGVYVTNISRRGFLFQGNNLRSNRLTGARPRFYNVSEAGSASMRAVTDCGWSWGSQFGDLDNDGLPDLVVANGFISASMNEEYWYDMSKVAGGAGNVFQDATKWPPIGQKSLSGYERTRVLWNRGKLRFAEVGESAGITDVYDGRAVALADLSGRGALDMIVANQKGPLLVYRCSPPQDNDWIQLRLVGAAHNPDAIGASVRLELGDGRKLRQSVLAGSGFSAQNDLTLHFGLGRGAQVAAAHVRWPSGREQDLGPLEARQRTVIQEPLP